MNCKTCNETIPQGRVDLGYKVCVECSEVEKYGCVDIVNHKTGNTIQVLPKDQAEKINKLSQRAGFGTLRSLRSGKSAPQKTKLGGNSCSKAFIGSEAAFERIGKECMMWVELEDFDRITKILKKAKDNFEISQIQYGKLSRIMKEFMPKRENKIEQANIKPVSEEIEFQFRNWKNSKIYR